MVRQSSPPGSVGPREGETRAYDSPLRRRRATQTQARIRESARRLMSTRPLRKATMSSIARDAGVSVESVHQVGSKQQLLIAALASVEERFGRLDRELMSHRGATFEDMVPVVQSVAAALAVWDDETSCLWTNAAGEAMDEEPVAAALSAITRRRLDDVRAVVDQLGSRPDLQAVTRELMILTSAETYVQLRRDEGLTAAEHLEWVSDAMRRALGVLP